MDPDHAGPEVGSRDREGARPIVSLDPSKLLATVPAALRDPLFEAYRQIASNFAEYRWKPSELEGGFFCECSYWICHEFATGTYAAAHRSRRTCVTTTANSRRSRRQASRAITACASAFRGCSLPSTISVTIVASVTLAVMLTPILWMRPPSTPWRAGSWQS